MCAFSASVRNLAESTSFGRYTKTAMAIARLKMPTQRNIVLQPSKLEVLDPCCAAKDISPPRLLYESVSNNQRAKIDHQLTFDQHPVHSTISQFSDKLASWCTTGMSPIQAQA